MDKRFDEVFIYSKIIEGIDDYYFNETERGSKKRLWIDNYWKQLSKQLVENFVEMVEEGNKRWYFGYF